MFYKNFILITSYFTGRSWTICAWQWAELIKREIHSVMTFQNIQLTFNYPEKSFQCFTLACSLWRSWIWATRSSWQNGSQSVSVAVFLEPMLKPSWVMEPSLRGSKLPPLMIQKPKNSSSILQHWPPTSGGQEIWVTQQITQLSWHSSIHLAKITVSSHLSCSWEIWRHTNQCRE